MTHTCNREVTNSRILLWIGSYGMRCVSSNFFWCLFCTVVTRRFKLGSRSGAEVSDQDRLGSTEDQVRERIHAEVVSIVQGQIPDLFGCINAAMMEFFDD